MKKTRATEELLGQLHEAVAKDLLAKVASGDATAQELQAAIKFLKDNGIESTLQEGSTVDKLSKVVLPNFSDDQVEEWPN